MRLWNRKFCCCYPHMRELRCHFYLVASASVRSGARAGQFLRASILGIGRRDYMAEWAVTYHANLGTPWL